MCVDTSTKPLLAFFLLCTYKQWTSTAQDRSALHARLLGCTFWEITRLLTRTTWRSNQIAAQALGCTSHRSAEQIEDHMFELKTIWFRNHSTRAWKRRAGQQLLRRRAWWHLAQATGTTGKSHRNTWADWLWLGQGRRTGAAAVQMVAGTGSCGETNSAKDLDKR